MLKIKIKTERAACSQSGTMRNVSLFAFRVEKMRFNKSLKEGTDVGGGGERERERETDRQTDRDSS